MTAIKTMGPVQTNADRTIIAIRHKSWPHRLYWHYNPDCASCITPTIQSLSNARYTTSYRAGDVQRALVEVGWELVTRQTVRADDKRVRCMTCEGAIW